MSWMWGISRTDGVLWWVQKEKSSSYIVKGRGINVYPNQKYIYIYL